MKPIVIVGGGIIGSSIAYHLASAGARVTVVEPDPSYEFAATPRAVGGIRLLHGLRQNVEMSLYGHQVFRQFASFVNSGAVEYDPAFRTVGYLFMASGAAAEAALAADAEMQRSLGVEVSLLDRTELISRYPSFSFPKVDVAALSPADGQIDPHAALMGYRRAAEHLGVPYVEDRVVDVEVRDGRARSIELQSGARLEAEIVINAANCWAPEICAMVGMKVPIAPMRRQQFFFKCRQPLEPIPVMREAGGFVIRPERDGYLAAVTNFGEARGFNWTLDDEIFEQKLWPALAERCPAFEAIRLQSGWVGHYDQCELDGNPIIGEYEGVVDGFYLVAGFSGHGLQHAPAVGRGVAEFLTTGRYQTIDLSPFSYQRVLDDQPLRDHGPKA